jgi:hypothetical protein
MGDVLEGVTPGEFESELLAMIAGFETSLNPFLSHNLYFEPVKHHMAEVTLRMLERQLAAASLPPKDLFGILRLLSRTRATVRTLSPDLRTRFQAVAKSVDGRLEKDRPDLYVRLENPTELRRRAAKRLSLPAAWLDWCEQVLDMRYAAEAGFGGIELASFYRQSVHELKNTRFRRSYVNRLCAVIVALGRSMSFHNAIAHKDMAYKNEADRLSDYGIRLLNWIGELQHLDCELISEVGSAVYKALGLGYNHDRSFGVIVRGVLDSQLPDGSWKTNPPPEEMPVFQEDYLRTMYRPTWACVDTLRPLRSDVLVAKNVPLGLV